MTKSVKPVFSFWDNAFCLFIVLADAFCALYLISGMMGWLGK